MDAKIFLQPSLLNFMQRYAFGVGMGDEVPEIMDCVLDVILVKPQQNVILNQFKKKMQTIFGMEQLIFISHLINLFVMKILEKSSLLYNCNNLAPSYLKTQLRVQVYKQRKYKNQEINLQNQCRIKIVMKAVLYLDNWFLQQLIFDIIDLITQLNNYQYYQGIQNHQMKKFHAFLIFSHIICLFQWWISYYSKNIESCIILSMFTDKQKKFILIGVLGEPISLLFFSMTGIFDDKIPIIFIASICRIIGRIVLNNFMYYGQLYFQPHFHFLDIYQYYTQKMLKKK
ncbi:unnamed protein product [Paramecium sonneborni]|uniref:Transmembrane protein n=1 Tax=Paramecium sonneborni TaxID=65129 RepID=A0A8S1RTM7_9CILI|nr:unnamed protein product [Paramecium sonneborni]